MSLPSTDPRLRSDLHWKLSNLSGASARFPPQNKKNRDRLPCPHFCALTNGDMVPVTVFFEQKMCLGGQLVHSEAKAHRNRDCPRRPAWDMLSPVTGAAGSATAPVTVYTLSGRGRWGVEDDGVVGSVQDRKRVVAVRIAGCPCRKLQVCRTGDRLRIRADY